MLDVIETFFRVGSRNDNNKHCSTVGQSQRGDTNHHLRKR